MCALIREHGGFEALLSGIQRVFKGKKGGLLGMGLLVGTMDIATANNTVAIVMATPLQRKWRWNIRSLPERQLLSWIHFPVFSRGLIPYGAQMLVAISAGKGTGI